MILARPADRHERRRRRRLDPARRWTSYDRPSSVFVAGLIGSPAMNFLAAKVAPGSRGVELTSPGAQPVTLPLATATSARTGTAVALGAAGLSTGAAVERRAVSSSRSK